MYLVDLYTYCRMMHGACNVKLYDLFHSFVSRSLVCIIIIIIIINITITII